jgi:hypothetical protein
VVKSSIVYFYSSCNESLAAMRKGQDMVPDPFTATVLQPG